MKYIFILGIILLSRFTLEGQNYTQDEISCTIKSDKTKYKRGNTPVILVEIKNNSSRDINLLGCLDGSNTKKRYPYCYFKVVKPVDRRKLMYIGCGNTSALRLNDFVNLPAGKSFDPFGAMTYRSIELDKRNFDFKGIYQIQFFYSTESKNIKDYLGDTSPDESLINAFEKISHIVLESNVLEVEFK